MQSRHLKLLAAATLTAWSLTAGIAHAAGVLTIGFVYGAYMTETFRGAIMSVPVRRSKSAPTAIPAWPTCSAP